MHFMRQKGVFLLHTEHVVRWTLRQRQSKQAEPNATNIFCIAVYGSKKCTRRVMSHALFFSCSLVLVYVLFTGSCSCLVLVFLWVVVVGGFFCLGGRLSLPC